MKLIKMTYTKRITMRPYEALFEAKEMAKLYAYHRSE